MKKFPLASCISIFLICGSGLKSDTTFEDDFLQYWNDVRENYAYFQKKHTDWEKVKKYYSGLAFNASSREDLIRILEKANEELYDNHFNLNTNLNTSTRMVPSGLDLWAEFIKDKAVVTEVRYGFSAWRAGIRPGMIITKINGIEVEQAVKTNLGHCITTVDNEVMDFVLRQLLAGNYITERVITLRDEQRTLNIQPDKSDGNLTDGFKYDSLLQVRILSGNTGYVRINNSLGDNELIKAFDSALLILKDTRALVLDLRETPGGGNSTVARAIMSRFIDTEMPYQKHVVPQEEMSFGVKRSWLELVTPRGPFTYNRKMVVLCSHWTGSMGEGIVIGFDAMKRATIIGSKMAGLNGSVDDFITTNYKVPFSFPTEQLFHVNGSPREDFIPEIQVDLTDKKSLTDPDPVLNEGLKFLSQ
ncbi:MAG TPA: S41 family peptidase [Lentimicrobium sp.]|nr:S41 family peptidase [Lentimicrobium sp.]